jgi:3-deoxy-manno-octulosonate cytidylyltransferase (CMP-KDO synthetase)
MIEHVYRRTAMCLALDDVFVATCDQQIMDAVDAFGGRAIMTSDSHQRASDRVAEAATNFSADIIVMIQGDEPMTYPQMIEAAVAPLRNGDKQIACVNLTARIQTEEDFVNPNTIKVVMDADDFAVYMSREPIPTRHLQPFDQLATFKQVCIIPFTAASLNEFIRLHPTALEVAESIDMLRFIENGRRVKMVPTEYATHAVDTPEDLKLVEELLQKDPLTKEYL